MKLKLLSGISATLLLLSGCGQNVEQIQTNFKQNNKTTADYAFSGYTVTFPEAAREQISEFRRNNRIPTNLHITDELAVEELPEVEYTPDSYEQLVAVREELVSAVAGLTEKAQKHAEVIRAKAQIDIDAAQMQVNQYQSQLDAYNKFTQEAQTAYDTLKSNEEALQEQLTQLQNEFDKAIKALIIEHKFPVSVNSTFRLSRHYDFRASYKCRDLRGRVKAQLADNPEHCIYIRDSHNEITRPVIIDYAKKHRLVYQQLSELRDQYGAVNKELRDAKIIAANQTGVNPSAVARNMRKWEQQIDAKKRRMEFDSDEAKIVRDLLRSDDQVNDIKSRYSSLAYDYHRDVKAHSIDEADIQIEQFDDEEAKYAPEEGDRAMALFIFEHEETERQTVIGAPLSEENNNQTYLQVFKGRTEELDGSFEIEDEDDVLAIVKTIY